MLKMKLEQKNLKSVKCQIWGQGVDQIYNKVWFDVGWKIRCQICNQIYNQVWIQVGFQILENRENIIDTIKKNKIKK